MLSRFTEGETRMSMRSLAVGEAASLSNPEEFLFLLSYNAFLNLVVLNKTV